MHFEEVPLLHDVQLGRAPTEVALRLRDLRPLARPGSDQVQFAITSVSRHGMKRA